MKKLLIADLRRIFKGKGIYVLMILGFIFPAISALIVQLSGCLLYTSMHEKNFSPYGRRHEQGRKNF